MINRVLLEVWFWHLIFILRPQNKDYKEDRTHDFMIRQLNNYFIQLQ